MNSAKRINKHFFGSLSNIRFLKKTENLILKIEFVLQIMYKVSQKLLKHYKVSQTFESPYIVLKEN